MRRVASHNATTEGPYFMKSQSFPKIAIVLSLALCLAPACASAACAPPSAAGVVICQPSANSTIFQVPHIEAAASPTSGSISSIEIFIDGKLALENSGGAINVFEGGVANGLHQLVVKATDGLGHTYQASENFAVTGNLPSSCAPSSVGVRICSPTQGQFVPNQFAMAIGFKGESRITHVRAYAGSTDVFDYAPSSGENQVFAGGLPSAVGAHTLTVVAWDSTGHVFSSKVGFNAFYEAGCPPKGDTCNPGVYVNTPQDGDDVTAPLRISANIEFNPEPITAMKAYLNGAVVAESSGPTLDQSVPAAKGTHILTIQGWDIKGHVYRTTGNVNVQ